MPLPKRKIEHFIEQKGWIVLLLGALGYNTARNVYKKHYSPSAIQQKSELNKSDEIKINLLLM